MRGSSFALAALAIAPLSLAACAIFFGPSSRAPVEFESKASPEQIARGEYLFTSVADCKGCHAQINPQTKALDRSLPAAGGGLYAEAHDVPGKVYVPNITQDKETGLGTWTNGEILRAIREGVDRNGRALFPLMPYGNCFRHLSDEDGAALVAYMRTLAPVKNAVPERSVDFPINLFIKLAPTPLSGAVSGPNPNDPVERGKYLATIAGCAECHTPRDSRGNRIEDKFMAGGNRIRLLDLKPDEPALYMPNLTQDKETGLGAWTDEQLRMGILKGIRPNGEKMAPQGPAAIFAGLKEQDVNDLIAYLRTVPAVKNAVPRNTPPTAKATTP